MTVLNIPNVPTQVASSFIGIESYVGDTNMIVTKHADDRTYIGRAYTTPPLIGGGSEFSTLIANIFKGAPDDSIVQVSLISTPDRDVPFFLCKGKTGGNELVQKLIDQQALLMEKSAQSNTLYKQPVTNKKTVVISLMIPAKKLDAAEIEANLILQNEFQSGLRSAGFVNVRSLTPAELIEVYRLFTNPYKKPAKAVIDDGLDLRKQVFGPDNKFDFRDKKIAVFDDSTYSAGIVPKALPSMVPEGMMNLLVGAPLNSGSTKEGGGQTITIPFILTASVRLANQLKEQGRLERVIASREKGNPLPFSLGKQNNEQIMSDLKYLELAGAEGVNKFVYTSITYFLYCDNKIDLEAGVSIVNSIFNNLGFDARRVLENYGPRWANSLPLNYSSKISVPLENETIMPATAAACLLPIYGDYTGNANLNSNNTGSVFLTRRGEPYYFDPFVTNGNKNGIIFAESGSGKSFVMQYLIINALAEGTSVFLFDNGKSAKKLCKAVGGEFVEFSLENENQSSLNPFSGLTDEEFNEQADIIAELIIKMGYSEGEQQHSGARIAMAGAVRAAWKKSQYDSDVTTVIESLRSMVNASAKDDDSEVIQAGKSLIDRLEAFMNSPSRGRFFRGKSSFDPRNPFVVFEMSGLDGDAHLKQCVLFFTLNTLMSRIKKQEGRKQIFLDEAWQILKDPDAASAIEGIFRKCRKDNAGIWVVTQSITDLGDSPTGQVVLAQSNWKLLLKQKSETIDKAVTDGLLSQFTNDPYFIRSAKDVMTVKGKFSEILISGEQVYESVRLFVDRFTSEMLSTEGETRNVVFGLMNEGMSAVEAINYVIGDEKATRSTWIKDFLFRATVEGVDYKTLLKELDEEFKNAA